jgi:hypothetical protein
VHARSEPEALLKMLLGQRGIDRFSAMAESGRIEPLGGPFPTWFTATDIEDLDLDPEGRVVRQEDALDMLNAHLERERADDADPSP